MVAWMTLTRRDASVCPASSPVRPGSVCRSLNYVMAPETVWTAPMNRTAVGFVILTEYLQIQAS